MYLQGRNLLRAITAACGIGFLLFGYDQGVMGGVIGSETFKERFHHPSATQQGLIVGLYDAGCLIGSLGSFLIPNFRRRSCIYFGASAVIVGTIIQVTSTTIAQLLAGRIITGIGVGTNTAIIPSWQAEVSPAKDRGKLITVEAALIILGLAVSNWLCFGASHATTSLQWQFPIAFQTVFALYLLVTVPFLVESPRWLADHASTDDARAVIARLLGKSTDDSEVEGLTNHIIHAIEEESKLGSGNNIFQQGREQNLRRMLLGVVGLLMQQMSGINAVAYYFPVILQEYIGLTPDISLILSGCAAVQFFFVSLVPVWCIEKLGRRTWMIWGALAQMLTMVLVVVGSNIDSKSGGILVTTMFFVFYDVFAVSYLNVPWMYAPEINNLKMRARGSALASASNWLFNGIVVTITPIALSNIGWKYWIVWIAMNASFAPLVFFFYPETRGLSLESIDQIFEDEHQGGLRVLTQGVRKSIYMASQQHEEEHATAAGESKAVTTIMHDHVEKGEATPESTMSQAR